MTAIIFEYEYERAGVSMDSEDYQEFDYVVIKLFGQEVTRLPVPSWKYWHDGERDACEETVLEWMKERFK